MDDLELLAKWRDGDTEAGNDLFDRYFKSIVRFVKNKLRDTSEVEDVVQRTFLACVEGRDRFEGRSSFKTYLFAVAHNIVIEHFRARIPRQTAFDTNVTAVADLDPTPSMVVAEREEQRLVVAALRQIPLNYQVVLELFYWERLTGTEIAEALDVPEGTVRFRIRKGKELLAKKVRQLTVTAAHTGIPDSDLQGWVESLRELASRRAN